MTFTRLKMWGDLINVQLPSMSTYTRVQQQLLFPVVRSKWQVHQQQLFNKFSGQQLTLLGDGRCDSPGYSAKYGTYTVMECETNAVVDFQVVQLGEPEVSTRKLYC